METRAVICVERMVNGKVKWLPLADQWAYRRMDRMLFFVEIKK
jgi:hypothetical protein